MEAKNETGMVVRCVLAMERCVNALYEFLGKKYPEESDIDEGSISRKEIEQRSSQQAPDEEDDVFGHRAWIAHNDDVAIGNQMFEENK